jgi:hypothetical protein
MDELRAKGVPEDEVQAFGARWGGRGERRYDSISGFIARRGNAVVDPVSAFETLCELGWVERGVETKCARCGLQTFVSIFAIEDRAQCPGCRASVRYTTGKDGLTIQYRLNTLIDLASDQGVLPHLLVIAALVQQSPHTSLLGGTLTTLPGGARPEVDILGVYDGKFVAGEVKTKARDFTPAQLERDISISAQLGVDVHILAATDHVPRSLFRSVQKIAKREKLVLQVLSEEDLRPPACLDS